MEGASDEPVSESYFYDLWNTHSKFWKAQTNEDAEKLGGWTWAVETRSERTRGIHKCDICCETREYLRENEFEANTAEWRKHKADHLARVRGTRTQYAQNKMDGRPGTHTVSCAADAADQTNTAVPIWESLRAALGGLMRLRIKVTYFLVHWVGVFAFLTMPWISHGGNLSITIYMCMFAYRTFDNMDTILVQIDGSSDNVNVTSVYYFIWMLLGAQKAGASLHTVRLSRLIVKHTHNDVDRYFSILSRFIWGCTSWGFRRRNVWFIKAFMTCVRHAHTDLKRVKMVHACFNFTQFFKNSRCAEIDLGIQDSYVIELSTDTSKPGIVLIRQKSVMGGVWDGPKMQYYPHRDGVDRPLPDFRSKPELARLHKWSNRKEVMIVLREFVMNELPVKIDKATREEIVQWQKEIPRNIEEVPAARLPIYFSPLDLPPSKDVEVQQIRHEKPPEKEHVVLRFGKTSLKVIRRQHSFLQQELLLPLHVGNDVGIEARSAKVARCHRRHDTKWE